MRRSSKIFQRVANSVLSLTLVVGLAPAFTTAAFADDASGNTSTGGSSSNYAAAFSLQHVDGTTTYNTETKRTDFAGGSNYVTSVKLQNPWGSCWAFAATAAAEISILYETGQTADENNLDLSEHHLAWFSNTHLPAEGEAGYDATDSQAGEGMYSTNGTTSLDGGAFYVATNGYASGVGAVLESVNESFEYHGKNKTIQNDDEGKPWYYSGDDDWSIDEQYRYYQSYQLEESFMLSTLLNPEDGSLETSSVDAVKEQLVNGRGVAVTFYADTSLPTEKTTEDTAQYINTKTWAHYTYDEGKKANHGVCIVGWDDNYSKENFLTTVNVLDAEGNVVLNDDGTPKTKTVSQPAGDGAWIVKNSWGSSSEDFPNNNKWGVDDSGYFYLSYYDKSVDQLQAYDFYTDGYWTDSDEYYVDQYDTAPATEVASTIMGSSVTMANVFEASQDSILRSISCLPSLAGSKVEYSVYLVDDATKAYPTNGTLVASGSYTATTGGFQHINLSDPVYLPKGQKYAVCEKMVLDYGGDTMSYVPMVVATNQQSTVDDPSLKSYTKMVVNKGESLLGVPKDGTIDWSDWTEYTTILRNNGTLPTTKDADNFPIKAYLEAAIDVSFDANGGIGSMDALHGYVGWKVTAPECTLTAPTGKKFAGWECDGVTYQPGDEIELSQSMILAAQWENIFPDVNDSAAWYYDSVFKAVDLGLFKGNSDGTFAPNATLTRGQLAVILWRYLNPEGAEAYVKADAKNSTGMSDVEDAAYYTGAANWAVAMGIINGKSDGNGGKIFDPSGTVTAEQFCAILSNAAEAVAPEGTAMIDTLADASSISSWARGACEWAMEQDVLHGYNADGVRTLRPQEGVSRGRAATLLVNAIDKGLLDEN